MQPDGGVDASDPQSPELPFAVPPVLIGVVETVEERLTGSLEQAISDATVAPGLGDDRLMSSPLDGASLDPAQDSSPSREWSEDYLVP
jgi:hypothetical protein